jgi:hypothetical protein
VRERERERERKREDDDDFHDISSHRGLVLVPPVSQVHFC